MLRRLLPWLVLAALAAGCREPGVETVTVDLARIPATSKAPPPPELPLPPRPLSPEVATVPGQPAIRLRDADQRAESEIRAQIAKEQREDLERLTKRLREFYARESERFEREQLRAYDEASREAYDKLGPQRRALLEAYAEKRAGLLAELALQVGFPDPNPRSVPPERTLTAFEQRQFDRRREIRAELNRLAAAYDADVKALFAGVDRAVAAEMERLRLAIARNRDENDRRAEAEARAQIPPSEESFGLQLLGPRRKDLPAVPPQSRTLPGSEPLAPAPRVPSKVEEFRQQDDLAVRDGELRIFLALKRYRLAEPGRRGRDVTDEFLAWRAQPPAGR